MLGILSRNQGYYRNTVCALDRIASIAKALDASLFYAELFIGFITKSRQNDSRNINKLGPKTGSIF